MRKRLVKFGLSVFTLFRWDHHVAHSKGLLVMYSKGQLSAAGIKDDGDGVLEKGALPIMMRCMQSK
jgi:uncharacterized protein YciI